MDNFIQADLQILLYYINRIASHRGLPYTVSISNDLINKTKTDEIQIVFNYLLHEKGVEESKIITTRSLTIPYNQYIDEKEDIINHMNQLTYEDVLIHTQFETQVVDKDEKYKWN